MADLEYIIQILMKARDEASPKIDALKAKIDSLKATNDAENAEKDLGRAVENTGRKTDEGTRKQERHRTELEKTGRASDDVGRSARNLGEDVENAGRAHGRAADNVTGHTKAQQEFSDALKKVRQDQEDAASGAEELRQKTNSLHAAWSDFENDLNRGSFSRGEAARGLKEFSGEFTNLSKKLERGGQDWKDTEATLDRIASKLKNPDLASTGGLARSFLRAVSGDEEGGRKGAIGEVFESIDAHVGDLGVRITGVSSALRGFFDLAKIGLSQQLITGVLSLAGGLVSVGSAAAQAGAALAGVFVSGLGQAIPMLSIVVAAAERFKNILQAVSIAEQAEQQHFYDPTEKQVLQLQQTSQLISSQQELSNSYIQLYEAQQRVKDSQIELTEARYTASRQTKELALAEKDAELEAEGANLGLIEARRQLQIDIQRGAGGGVALQQAELAVKEAELNKQKAEFAIPKAEREERLARERKVTGEPAVISAVEGLEGAKVAVLQAKQAGEAAERQEEITKLQAAARSSKETTYESQLKFLKKGMSPTELGLTDALIGIEKELRSPDSPLKKITDYFVEPFTDAVQRIRSLLKNANFLEPIDNLAKAMGTGLGRLEHATYGGEGTSFFEIMARDATQNIPVVSQAIERIMKLFEDVAKAADPAFHRLSEDWNKFWGSLDRKYEGNGLEKLTDFFNKSAEYAEHFAELGKALYGLFVSIGRDAAPQGDKTVTNFTESVKEATGWVQSHGPEVTKFFREAREGLSIIGQMLFGIGGSIVKVFSLSSISAFSGFLRQVLLPGLRNVVGVLGFITTKILNIFNLFGSTGRVILETIGTIIGFSLALAKIVAVIKSIIQFIKEMKAILAAIDWEALILNPWIAIAAIIGGAAYALGIFSDGQKKVKVSTEELTQALENQAQTLRTIKGLNDEYKSSELSVKEARTQVVSAEQYLAKSKKEPLLQGETEQERKLKIEQNEQQLSRAKITRDEREKELKELPQQQKETSQRNLRENSKDVEVYNNKVKELSERVNQDRRTYSLALPEYRGEIQAHLVKEEKELTEAKEQLTNATKKHSEATKQSNELISQSVNTTAKNAPKLNEAYGEAYRKFEDSVRNGASVAKSGMAQIRGYVDDALKKYGVSSAEISGEKPTVVVTNKKTGGQIEVPTYKPKYAAGEYVRAHSGGRSATIAEGGHDEVVLTTDPRHASRQKQLLGHYLQNAPHMATGGVVGEFNKQYGGTHLARLLMAMDKVSAANFPYVYGGGHEQPSVFQPFDCSGAISYVTQQAGYGVPTTVSGDIGAWGFPSGDGLATIFYNPVHTFMRAGGRYFGTSGFARQRDKGGAGWFESTPDSSYLSGFSAVHLPDVEGTGTWSSTAKILENYGQKLTDKGIGSTAKAFSMAAASAAGNVKKAILETGIGGFTEIMAPRIKGGGAVGSVVQGAMNLATKAANIYLSKKASLYGQGQGTDSFQYTGHSVGGLPSSGLSSGQRIFANELSRYTGLNERIIGAWMLNEESGSAAIAREKEKNFNWLNIGYFDSGPGAITANKYFNNPVSAGQITAQFLEGRWGGASAGIRNILNSVGKGAAAEIAAIQHSGWASSGEPLLPNLYGEGYASGGIISPHRMVTDSIRRLAIRHLRKKVLKFASGGRAPWGGEPVPIVAHAGERIMNPAQYHETARLAGTSPGGLDRHLGYDSFPRQHFADGGLVVKNPGGTAQPITTTPSPSPIQDIINKLTSFSPLLEEPGSDKYAKNIVKLFETISKGFKKLKSAGLTDGKYAEEMAKFIQSIVEETSGVLAKIREGRESIKAKRGAEKVEVGFSGVVANRGVKSTADGRALSDLEKLKTVKLSSLGESGIEEKEFSNLASEGKELANENSRINSLIGKIKNDLVSASKMSSKTSKDRSKKTSTINSLKDQYVELIKLQKGLFEEMSSNVEARYQAETQLLQDKITEANNAYQTVSQEQTTQLSSIQSLGQLGKVGGIEQQMKQSAENQLNSLAPLLKEAEAIGNKELATTLKQEMSSLRQTINNAISETISNAQTLIQRESGLAESKTSLMQTYSKIAAQEGKFSEAGQLEKQALEYKGQSLLSTRSQEENLLKEAREKEDIGVVITLTEELNKNSGEIAENNLALKENAVVTRELVLNQIQATGQFRTGIYGAAAQGLETLGNITGYHNIEGLLSAHRGEERTLGTERSELEGQAGKIGLGVEGMSPSEILTYLASPAGQSKIAEMEQHEDKGEKESMYKLITALESNATNTLKNAEEIAKLNGQLNQPQSFSTQAWQQFRTAFFSGMGELNPSYAASLPAGAVPTELPKYGEMAPGASGAAPTIGNLNMTHPVQVLDPVLFGEQLQHIINTTPAMQ